ncbi:sensor histidine kinase [Bounagaea algeriensis]
MLNNDPDAAARPTPETGASAMDDRGGRWRLRNWRLWWKMAAVLLVPTIAALGVGGVRVYDGLAATQRLSALTSEVELAQRSADLAHELQRERDLAVIRTTSDAPAAEQDYNAQAQRVDQATRQLEAVGGSADEFSPEVRDAYDSATNRSGSLEALRSTVNSGFTTPQTVNAYNSILSGVLGVGSTVARTATDTEVNDVAQAADALGRAKEQLAQQRSLLTGASMRGVFRAGEADSIRQAKAQYEAALREFTSAATPQQLARYNATVAGEPVDRSEQMEQNALIASDAGDPVTIDAGEWSSQATARTDLLRQVEQQAMTEFHDRAADLTSSVRWAAVRDAVAVVLLLAVAFGVAAYIARSMLQPLRTLRYGALDIAQERLPEAITRVNDSPAGSQNASVPPVPVHSHEEIGQVARAFDAVHQQALRLASEQALLRANINDLFVNLARRSQTLVQRQLSLIDQLEQDEQDPDQLASLFELDHLATRMRRNNENLLILGGTDLTRRMVRPVPFNEVLGAAVSEVEQYARIAVADAPDLALQGRMVNDFVHLAAELFENATVYSNPETEVTVRTVYRRQQLVVEIRDRGVGIDPDDLEEINERLQRPPEIDVAASRRMGLYVVGQLAQRNDIGVFLSNNEDLEGGATATVQVPGQYVYQLTSEGPKPMPDMPRPDQRDSVTDTGSHLGLAAAFAQGGLPQNNGADPSGTAAVEARELPPLSPAPAEQHPSGTGPAAAEPTGTDPAGAEGGEAGAAATAPADYSVRYTADSPVGATDVPSWEAEWPAAEPAGNADTTGAPAEAPLWPSEDLPEGIGGTCGVPADASNDLFNNPFEAEKTTQLERVPAADAPEQDGFPAADPQAAEEQDAEPGIVDSGTAEQQAAGPEAVEPGAVEPGAAAPESAAAPGAPRREGHPMADRSAGRGESGAAPQGAAGDDAPTQRLPIYEAVLSQWFRESDVDEPMLSAAQGGSTDSADEDEPVANGAAAGGVHGPAVPQAGEQLGAYPSTPRPDANTSDVTGSAPAPEPEGAAPEPGNHAAEAEEPAPGLSGANASASANEAANEAADETAAGSQPTAGSAGDDPGWGHADAGWKAAEALLENQQPQQTTAAGLPKRVPKSNLVPGSAESRSQSEVRPEASTPRSAEAVRGRMSNFQQGIRRGRHSKTDSASDESPSRHEEQE